MGDAAHAVTSVLGQGCNTALSTCSALDRALADHDLSHTQQLNGALEAYNADWLPQAHALQQLEYMSVSQQTNIPTLAIAAKNLASACCAFCSVG